MQTFSTPTVRIFIFNHLIITTCNIRTTAAFCYITVLSTSAILLYLSRAVLCYTTFQHPCATLHSNVHVLCYVPVSVCFAMFQRPCGTLRSNVRALCYVPTSVWYITLQCPCAMLRSNVRVLHYAPMSVCYATVQCLFATLFSKRTVLRSVDLSIKVTLHLSTCDTEQ